MQGYNYNEISANIPYSDEKYIMRITQKLKQEGRITDAEIEQAKFDRNEKRKMETVLKGLRKGLSYQEIAASEEDLELSEQQYVTCKKKLLESGAITTEEMLAAREERKTERSRETRENYEAPNDNRILTLSMLGFNLSEISTILEVVESYVSRRRTEVCKKKGISKKKINKAIQDRQKNAEKRTNGIYRMATLDKVLKGEVVEDHLEYVKAKLMLGEVELGEVKSLSQVLPIYPEFIKSGSVNIIIRGLIQLGREDIAFKFIKECLISLEREDSRRSMLDKAEKIVLEYSRKKRERRRTKQKPESPGGDGEMSL